MDGAAQEASDLGASSITNEESRKEACWSLMSQLKTSDQTLVLELMTSLATKQIYAESLNIS